MTEQLLKNRASKTLMAIVAFLMVAISANAQEPTWTAEGYDCLTPDDWGWSGPLFDGGYKFDNITVEYYEGTNTIVAKNFMGGEGYDLTITLDADGNIKTINGEEQDSYGSMGVFTGNDDYYFGYLYPDYSTYVNPDKDNGYIIVSGYYYKDYTDSGTWAYYMISWPKAAPAEKTINATDYSLNTLGGKISFEKNIELAGGATTLTVKSTSSRPGPNRNTTATISLDPDDYKSIDVSFASELKRNSTYTIEIPDNCIKSTENEAVKDTVITFTVTEKGTTVVEEPAWTTHASVWTGNGYVYNPDNNDVIVSYYEKSHTLKIQNYAGDWSDELSVVVNVDGGTDSYGDYAVSSINGEAEYGGGYTGWNWSASSYMDPYWVDLYVPYCYALPECGYGEFGGSGYAYNNDGSSYWAYYYISWYNPYYDDQIALENAIADANYVIDYANAQDLVAPISLTSAVEAGQAALDNKSENEYAEKAAAIKEAMSSDYLQIMKEVAKEYEIYINTPVGVNGFELTPVYAAKLSDAFAAINNALSTEAGVALLIAKKDFEAALDRYTVTLPKTDETFTIQDKVSGLYLNIADGKATTSGNATYFQFHKVVNEETGETSWYLYNTLERVYMGYDDELTSVVEAWSRRYQFYVGSVNKNVWYISPVADSEKAIMADRYNNVVFGTPERAHSQWYIAYAEQPSYNAVPEEDEAEATAITSTQAAEVNGTYYTTSGAKLAGAQKGINIVKYSNGTVKKVLVK